jgi:eukaryotic-like serine/threonine-protein kinase
MATVHRAIERGIEGFERVVALKRLLPHLAEDEGFVRAFVREAKLASLLQHGNIVQLYELGRVGASYFISMEYIPGRDLRVILRQARRVCGPPPVEIALALMTELLDALDYAHSQCGADGKPLGLVHRDISPSNLIVSHTGHLKIIDFGIAKATLGHLMTHTGRIKGKLSYMAPEALAGRTLDGRSDLFSASVIAHELLTATPLFAAKDDFQTIDRLQNMHPPPPSAKNPSCPPELDEIVARGLAKDPTKRWRSAAEMRAALAELAIDHHRLATNREVCDWVEEAFEMPLPSRLRLPLSPPSASPPVEAKRQSGVFAQVDADDEIMDIVWGVTGPRPAMPVVLDEVPDVSARFSRLDPEALGEGVDDALAAAPLEPLDSMSPLDSMGAIDQRDPMDLWDPRYQDALNASLGGEEEPTNAVTRPNLDPPELGLAEKAPPAADARVTFRSHGSRPLSLVSAAAVAERTPQGGLATPPARRTQTGLKSVRPNAWPIGTAPTTQQELLEEAVSAARKAERLSPPSTTTTFTGMASAPRPSLLPLLVASVAVAAAGAAIAWILSSNDGDEVPAQVATAATVQPLAAQPQQARVRELAPEPAPAAEPSPAMVPDPNRAESGEGESDESGLRDRGVSDPRKRRPKLRREVPDERAERAVRAEREERERVAAVEREPKSREEAPAEEPEDRAAGTDRQSLQRDARSEERTAAAPPAGNASTQAAAPAKGSDVEGGVTPAPVPPPAPAIQQPRTRPAPARPSGPIIVPANRTRREGGSTRPIRFPSYEQPPKAITAKLCIDIAGGVTSVKVLTPVSPGVRSVVERSLAKWRYRPVVEGDDKVAACFATTFRLQVDE